MTKRRTKTTTKKIIKTRNQKIPSPKFQRLNKVNVKKEFTAHSQRLLGMKSVKC